MRNRSHTRFASVSTAYLRDTLLLADTPVEEASQNLSSLRKGRFLPGNRGCFCFCDHDVHIFRTH